MNRTKKVLGDKTYKMKMRIACTLIFYDFLYALGIQRTCYLYLLRPVLVLILTFINIYLDKMLYACAHNMDGLHNKY